MKQAPIKTTIPYFCLIVDFNRLKEMNTNPEEWAELLSKIRKHIEVSVEDEQNFFAGIDHALLDIMGKTLEVTFPVYKHEIEFKLENNTLYIIIKYEKYFVVDIEEC